ncbi:MAG TPA: class IV adenylate cyclase [Candidatus Binataceae bacterium]|nr:class IV adenylate cyclase [Candidatus Binataceae bacterium]
MRNLEAKFKLTDLPGARARAERSGLLYRATLVQRDTFYRVAHGKLKLREESAGAALIHYRRELTGDLEVSDYTIVAVAEPLATRAMLERALGVIAVVDKRRMLLTRDHLRLHLDVVEGLGEFGEIEIIVRDGEAPAAYEATLREVLEMLGVQPSALIRQSYFELMAARPAA